MASIFSSLLAMLFVAVIAQEDSEKQQALPLLLFGGASSAAGSKGFIMAAAPGSNIKTPQQFFSQEVYSATCLAGGRAIVSVGDVLHDGDPATGSVSTLALSAPANAMLPLIIAEPPSSPGRGSAQEKVVVLVGGMFSGGLLLWDGKSPIAISPPVSPPCVRALALAPDESGDVIVAGCFSGIQGDNSLEPNQGIVRMSMSSAGPSSVQYSSLGSGLYQAKSAQIQVYSLSTANGCIFAGGIFSRNGAGTRIEGIGMICTGGPPVNTPLHHPPATKASDWLPLTDGVRGKVLAILAQHRSERGLFVFVGGNFCSLSNPDVCNVAEWSTGLGWKQLGRGVRGTVHSLLVIGNYVYVGGRFVCPETRTSNFAAWSIGNLNPGRWGDGGLLQQQEASPGKINTIVACPCPQGTVVNEVGACLMADLAALTARKKQALAHIKDRTDKNEPSSTRGTPESSYVLFVIIVFLFIASAFLWRERQKISYTQMMSWREVNHGGNHSSPPFSPTPKNSSNISAGISTRVGCVADWSGESDNEEEEEGALLYQER